MILTVYPDVIRKSDQVRLSRADTVLSGAQSMRSRSVGAILVMDANRIEGIFTERDLVTRVVARGLDPAETAIGSVMTPDPHTIDAHETVIATLERMERSGYRHLPVTDGEAVVGMVAARDVIRACDRQFSRALEEMEAPATGRARQVAAVMREAPVVRADATDTVRMAAETMARHKVGAVLVTEGDRLAGILTERDIVVRIVAEGRDPASISVESAMTANPGTTTLSERSDAVLARMIEGGFRHVPVVDGGKVVGVVSLRDLYAYARGILEHEFRAAMRERARRMTADG